MILVRRLFCLQLAFLAPLFLLAPTHALASDTLLGGGHKSASAPSKHGPLDTIVFTNGDRLTGTFIREVGGTVTFHSDIVGDIKVHWSKIKELHSNTSMAVLKKSVAVSSGEIRSQVPIGPLTVSDGKITIEAPKNQAAIAPIPVKSAEYIIDKGTLQKEVLKKPGFFDGWNGAFTAGATIVHATQKQYTFTGAVALARVMPTVSWLDTRTRTTIDFSGSYGKITQPGYISEGVFYPPSDSKSSIFHAAAEHDRYFSPRMYALGQTGFDHNYSQGLDLQQVYGGGIGYTVLKHPRQELDFKGSVQYEKQEFLNASDGVNQNLIGSTFAGVYVLHLPRGLIFNQKISYLPAYNNDRAYSAGESDTLAIPFYRSLSFSVGTLDSYLNDPPPAVPPTLKNSFQFTFGATYGFKSRY